MCVNTIPLCAATAGLSASFSAACFPVFGLLLALLKQKINLSFEKDSLYILNKKLIRHSHQ